MKQITFYTDGACSGNPGEDGWAYVEVGQSTPLITDRS